eukprot:360244-Chlamydomonas_euryale.AAC.6
MTLALTPLMPHGPSCACSGLSTAIGRMAFSSRRQSAQASTRASCACRYAAASTGGLRFRYRGRA